METLTSAERYYQAHLKTMTAYRERNKEEINKRRRERYARQKKASESDSPVVEQKAI